MRNIVLGIGYPYHEHAAVRETWFAYGIEFDFADDLWQAATKLVNHHYICIAICSDCIPSSDIDTLRKIQLLPIVVVPPEYSVSQRYDCVQQGVAQYVYSLGQQRAAALSGKDSMRFCLDLSEKERLPLTMITVNDLCFCLEYRTVEVRGQQVELTRKEFSLLHLLITHPSQVFTFEMLFQYVWQEEYSLISKKTLNNHMSSLNRKLKVNPNMPNYIINIHGIGYKYELS